MIVAILSKTSDVESLLNSLSEADFDMQDVSVIMQDLATRSKIAPDAGPLKGVQPAHISPALLEAGLTKDAAKRCKEALGAGKIVVAMKVDPKYEAAARESFKDVSAELV